MGPEKACPEEGNMFRKAKQSIDGIELPDEFSDANIINNVAISSDGKRYALVKGGNVVCGDMPPDGKLNIDGIIINFQKGIPGAFNIKNMSAGRSIVTNGNICISGGGISIGGGSISIGGKTLPYEINEAYESVKKAMLRETSNNITLKVSNDDKVYVEGFTGAKPECNGRQLYINRFQGTLKLPTLPLELDIKTSSGDIKGVAHRGSIRTSSGDVNLILHIPVIVEVSTSSGDIDVVNMIHKGRGIYVPSDGKADGTLKIDTSSGDVSVRYISHPDHVGPKHTAQEE